MHYKVGKTQRIFPENVKVDKDKFIQCVQPPDVLMHIKNIIQQYIIVADKINVKTWPIGGTLIGAARHQGIIPWDDDADFAVFLQDYSTIRNALLRDDRFIVRNTFFGFDLRLKNPKDKHLERYCLDVFTIAPWKIPWTPEYHTPERDPDMKWVYAGHMEDSDIRSGAIPNYAPSALFPKQFWYGSELSQNFVTLQFEDLTLHVPAAYDLHLRRNFGEDYMTNGSIYRIKHFLHSGKMRTCASTIKGLMSTAFKKVNQKKDLASAGTYFIFFEYGEVCGENNSRDARCFEKRTDKKMAQSLGVGRRYRI